MSRQSRRMTASDVNIIRTGTSCCWFHRWTVTSGPMICYGGHERKLQSVPFFSKDFQVLMNHVPPARDGGVIFNWPVTLPLTEKVLYNQLMNRILVLASNKYIVTFSNRLLSLIWIETPPSQLAKESVQIEHREIGYTVPCPAAMKREFLHYWLEEFPSAIVRPKELQADFSISHLKWREDGHCL